MLCKAADRHFFEGESRMIPFSVQGIINRLSELFSAIESYKKQPDTPFRAVRLSCFDCLDPTASFKKGYSKVRNSSKLPFMTNSITATERTITARATISKTTVLRFTQ